MRREHFAVEVRDAEAGQPVLAITYEGPAELLTKQLSDEGDDPFAADEIDAAYRLQDPLEESNAEGVFSLTHRLTGEYLIEVNVSASALLSMIQAVRDTADEEDVNGPSYRVSIDPDGESVTYDMDALFVYDVDGDLLRQRSLIPSGVEL